MTGFSGFAPFREDDDVVAINPDFCQHCYDLGSELGAAQRMILDLRLELDQTKRGHWSEPCAMCGNPFRVPDDIRPAPTQCRSCHAGAWPE